MHHLHEEGQQRGRAIRGPLPAPDRRTLQANHLKRIRKADNPQPYILLGHRPITAMSLYISSIVHLACFVLLCGISNTVMEATTIRRKQTSFRLREDLLEKLQISAMRENRSLNNFVESKLMEMYYQPNDETLEAIREATSGEELETLDLDHFDDFVKSL